MRFIGVWFIVNRIQIHTIVVQWPYVGTPSSCQGVQSTFARRTIPICQGIIAQHCNMSPRANAINLIWLNVGQRREVNDQMSTKFKLASLNGFGSINDRNEAWELLSFTVLRPIQVQMSNFQRWPVTWHSYPKRQKSCRSPLLLVWPTASQMSNK